MSSIRPNFGEEVVNLSKRVRWVELVGVVVPLFIEGWIQRRLPSPCRRLCSEGFISVYKDSTVPPSLFPSERSQPTLYCHPWRPGRPKVRRLWVCLDNLFRQVYVSKLRAPTCLSLSFSSSPSPSPSLFFYLFRYPPFSSPPFSCFISLFSDYPLIQWELSKEMGVTDVRPGITRVGGWTEFKYLNSSL